jgi:tetratricopeptide (TPR) repeat protein
METILRRRVQTSLGLLCITLGACRTLGPTAITRVPDPVAEPVVGTALDDTTRAAARLAVSAAERGDTATSQRQLALLPVAHPIRRLAELEVAYLGGKAVGREALVFAEGTKEYGAAWGFAAIASRNEGALPEALRAARRAGELQPGGGWGTLAAELEQKIGERMLSDGNRRLQNGDGAGALTIARQAMRELPNAVGARLLAARALLALADVNGAAELVPGIPDSQEGLELKGKVAERLGQWEMAVQLYERLPAGDPRRCELLATARDQVRLANAPPYLTKALTSEALNRRGLAAIILWSASALAAKATGPVPMFEDVVQLQERADILTVARAGVMPGDPISRRFGAERSVSARELTAVTERLASILGRPKPSWCGADKAKECVEVPSVLTGREAARLVSEVTGEVEAPCPRH